MTFLPRAVAVSVVFAVLLVPARAQQRVNPFQADAAAGSGNPGVISSMELVDTPITTVFKMVSDLTGWSIVLSPDVSAKPPKVNIWIKNLAPEQALERVASIAGLVADRKGNTVEVMTFDEYTRLRGVEKRVVPLKNARAPQIAANLQPFVAKDQAKVLADAESNKLILLVPEPLLDSLLKLVETLDVPFEKDAIKVVVLKHLEASVIVPKLELFLTDQDRAAGGGGGAVAATFRLTPSPANLQGGLAPAGDAGGAPPAVQGVETTRAGSRWLVQFLVEPKLNAVVLRGLPTDVAQTEELISKLDVAPPVSIVPYPLKYTNSREVFQTLQTLIEEDQRRGGASRSGSGGGGYGGGGFGGAGRGGQDDVPRLKVAVSEQNNRIVVEGSPRDQERMAKIIAAIDRPLPATSGGIRVYRLENSTAQEVATVIQGVIDSQQVANSRAAREHRGPADMSQRGVRRVGDSSAGGAGTPAAGPAPAPGAAPPPAAGPTGAGGATAAPGAAPAGAPEAAAGDVTLPPQVTAAPEINAVVIRATAAEHSEFESLIRDLDRPRDQVMLEVTVVSVRSNNDFSVGVEFGAAHLDATGTGTNTIGFSTFGVGAVDPATGKLRFPTQPAFGLNFGVFKSDDFSLVLNTLKTVGDTRVTATPRVLVEDNATAKIEQLNREPFVTVSQGTNTTLSSFGGFAEAGTTLQVIPHVSREDWLRLDYAVNLSSFDQRTPQQLAANLPPPVRQNSSEGTVRIPSDYTVVLGGLASTQDQRVRQGIPFLSEVPLLRLLFGTETDSRARETLFIFIRPVLLRDPAYRDLRYLSESDVRAAKMARRDFPKNELKVFLPRAAAKEEQDR